MTRQKWVATGLVASLLLFALPALAAAEAKFLLEKQVFLPSGGLKQPLTVDFDGSGDKPVFAETKPIASERAALVLAWGGPDGDALALQLLNSTTYVCYKTRLRDEVHEELVVLGLGRERGISVELKEIAVLGAQEDGTIGLLPLVGFAPVDYYNAPLQQNTKRQILFPLSAKSGKAPALLFWEPAKQAVRFAASNT